MNLSKIVEVQRLYTWVAHNEMKALLRGVKYRSLSLVNVLYYNAIAKFICHE